MAERHASGVLDTCVYIDLDLLDPTVLPEIPELTAVTLAELHHGLARAKDPASRAARTEKLGSAILSFDPLPFDSHAATRYGTLVTLTLAANRDPRPRRLDLMIAAIASSLSTPLYTRNPKDFIGLESMVEIVAV
ncbi:twitching motility protein PilT [Saccharothrix sp. ALI-22-I]|uniref:type II toxin-antitoxin system VapC family toxin n=1 Tax=Saccharothrix sp. ALI-22-I TaxID=1933778 RepID=UPI00097BA855|nr:type II toxin-antitoxin system VapC family toxin [Saccharothrix sp. ALI-22-I]ONI81809.1 twitching motility protein PilT [Saccharothrix sp. ALI-22-I]